MKNQQKWLTKKIPREWTDKDALLELVIFECLIHFVEREKGLRDIEYDWSKDLEDGHVTEDYVNRVWRRERELWSCYNYIKSKRPEMVKKMYDTEDCMEFERLENELYEEDSFTMRVIIENRGYLWT